MPSAAPAIPDVVTGDVDTLTAALAYASAGLYIGPLAQGSKNPGSRLGKGWPSSTSRDPHVIAAWFAGSNDGPFLHAGRSDLVVLDVDAPEQVPADWWPHLLEAPFQSTREDDVRRGHYVFAQPPGRLIGNSVGRARRGWGEVRGTNGVIVLAPTQHEKAAQGGRYQWRRTGAIPVLPPLIADLLPDGEPGEASATDSAVASFLDRHTGNAKPHLARAAVEQFAVDQQDGSRHDACVRAACWIAREATAGLYPARQAFDELREAFEASIGSERPARPEFEAIAAWAVGQVTPDRVADVQRKHGTLRPARQLTASPPEGSSSTDDEGGESEAEWLAESPRPLMARPMSPVPEFPVEVLPDVLARHVRAVAEASLTPLDFAAVACLGAISTACGGRARVRVNRTYEQPLNVYFVPIAGPGEGKTPAFAPFESVLFDWQTRCREAGREDRATAQANHEAASERVEAARAAIRQALKPSGKPKLQLVKDNETAAEANVDDLQADLGKALLKAEEAPAPVTPTVVITGNATPEALLRVLAENGGRLSVIATEGRIIDIVSGAYSTKADITPLLMAYDGQLIDGHRIGRDIPDVQDPALTICVAVQPVLWIEAMRNRQLRDRGLIPRVLACYPKPMIGRRDRPLTEVPEAIETPALDRLMHLLQEAARHTNTVLRLSGPAYAAFEDYRRELDRRSPEGRDLHRVAAWAAKHAARAVRLAGLLHLADDPEHGWTTSVAADDFARARAIADYYVAHQLALLDAAEEDESTGDDSAPAYLLRYLQRRDQRPEGWSLRDLSRAVSKSRFPGGESDLRGALEVLADYGWVRLHTPDKTRQGGRPPSLRVMTHPAMHAQDKHGGSGRADFADVADNGRSPAETTSASPADIGPSVADIAPDAQSNVGNVGNVAELADSQNPWSEPTVGNVGKVGTAPAYVDVTDRTDEQPVTSSDLDDSHAILDDALVCLAYAGPAYPTPTARQDDDTCLLCGQPIPASTQECPA